jgi:hypothetical protein
LDMANGAKLSIGGATIMATLMYGTLAMPQEQAASRPPGAGVTTSTTSAAGRLVVTLLNDLTSQPVAGGAVTVRYAHVFSLAFVKAGQAVIERKGTDEHRLAYEIIRGVDSTAEYRTVTEADWAQGDITWVLPFAEYEKHLRVSVVDAGTHLPLPDVSVCLLLDEHSALGVKTDERGQVTFGWRGRPQNAGYRISISHYNGLPIRDGGVRQNVTDKDWAAGGMTVPVAVPQVSVVAKFTLKTKTGEHPPGDARIVLLGLAGMDRQRAARCKDGLVTFADVPKGRYLLQADDYVIPDAKVFDYDGATLLSLSATLVPKEEYQGNIHVRAQDEKQVAIAGANATLTNLDSKKTLLAKTDAKGNATWEALGAGGYMVEVVKDGFTGHKSYPEIPGGNEVVAVMERVYRLEVATLDEAGKPAKAFCGLDWIVAGDKATTRPGEVKRAYPTALATGAHDVATRPAGGMGYQEKSTFENVREGKYLLSAKGQPGAGHGAMYVEVPAKQEVNLKLAPGFRLDVEITGQKEGEDMGFVFINGKIPDAAGGQTIGGKGATELLEGSYTLFLYSRRDTNQFFLVGEKEIRGTSKITVDVSEAGLKAMKKMNSIEALSLVMPVAPKPAPAE